MGTLPAGFSAEGSIEVERAVWHRHGDLGAHWHTAEQYKHHSPITHESFLMDEPPPPDPTGTEH